MFQGSVQLQRHMPQPELPLASEGLGIDTAYARANSRKLDGRQQKGDEG